jgi:hypothetical protein
MRKKFLSGSISNKAGWKIFGLKKKKGGIRISA